MAQVKNKATGIIHDVPDNHWALESSDYEVIQPEPVKEDPKPESKSKTKKD